MPQQPARRAPLFFPRQARCDTRHAHGRSRMRAPGFRRARTCRRAQCPRARAGDSPSREEIDADLWFSNWERGGVLLEEARYLAQWDQILTLLWFDSEEVPSSKRPTSRWDRDGDESREPRDDEDELGLKELDGNLRWPTKKRRR